MKFSRLHLSGFKSFIDPVDLDILPGLTAIVGPNGCGKSNLLEALRWVMGETSYKSMRGSGMEDVIFSGTNTRPPRNFAEVSLQLDNTDHSAPAEYNNADMVEVVRYIERDAGSSYRINGRDVRARDVQLMFADASTGARSPSLVKQGHIGELINAKPENRRKILEEAAGISGLHTRRHEAELRLRAAENNLEKTAALIDGLETQLRGLKRQMRQATRYRNLSGQIREVQALVLHVRWQQAVDAAEQASQELRAAETQVAELTGQVAKANKEQLDIQNRLSPLREAETKAAASLRRLLIERDGLDQEEARAQQLTTRLTEQITAIEQDKTHEVTSLADAKQQITRLEDEHAELTAKSQETMEADKVQAADTESQVKKAEQNLAEVEIILNAANNQIAARDMRQREYKTILENHTARHAQIETELSSLQDEREKLRTESMAEQKQATLKAEIAEAVEAEQNAAKASMDAQKKLAQANQKAESLRVPAKTAQAAFERLLGEQETLSAIFNIDKSAIQPAPHEAQETKSELDKDEGNENWTSVIDELSIRDGYQTALAAALGDNLTASSDPNAPAYWQNWPTIENAPRLPEGATPLTEFISGASCLTRCLSQIGVVEVAQGNVLHDKLQPGQILVSIEGDIWRWDGYRAGANATTPAIRALALRHRPKTIALELKQAEAAAAQAHKEAETASQAAKHAAIEDTSKRRELREAQEKLNALRQTLTDSEQGTMQHKSRLVAIEEISQRMITDMQAIKLAIGEAENKIEKLNQEADPAQHIDEKRQAVAEAQEKLAACRAAQSSQRHERNLRETRLAQIATDLDEWQKRASRAEQQIATLTTRATQAKAEKTEAEAVPAGLVERRNKLLDRITEVETDRQSKADKLTEAETALTNANKQLKTAEAELNEAREARARFEATVEANTARVEENGQRIREALQIEPEEALAISKHDPQKPFPDREDIEAKLERYQRERENLGGVNLRADEEAKEISEQIETLSSECDDLTKAINKLRYGIGQLNREGRERLLAAFETVNNHFQQLFKQLFGGGTAELQFTESDDPLEAGLDILAHPPGKKPQLMSLLSGGEQALTALSLIFAVFLTNPSPICVLDEVDAPLDDSNVERFCNMITEIASTTDTRFLLITHHALTMARVDRLFGVTMQERGVSELVSVDLATAEQFAETNTPANTPANAPHTGNAEPMQSAG
ncbi:MAG: chromosome segregation protein SMC [Alphaproteobacteria bacterium]|nr:chromosome segregation protein SMC [Alphaproteobacteria bacterium]